MNILSKITTISALALLGTAAQAQDVCRNCLNSYFAPGSYLGSYWPGERGTFLNPNVNLDKGSGVVFNNWWIFDVNQNGVVVFTISTKAATALDASNPEVGGPFGAEISVDHGSECGSGAGATCGYIAAFIIDDILLSEWAERRTWTFKTGPLVPGRYLFRLIGATSATGTSAYSGTISVRAK